MRIGLRWINACCRGSRVSQPGHCGLFPRSGGDRLLRPAKMATRCGQEGGDQEAGDFGLRGGR